MKLVTNQIAKDDSRYIIGRNVISNSVKNKVSLTVFEKIKIDTRRNEYIKKINTLINSFLLMFNISKINFNL